MTYIDHTNQTETTVPDLDTPQTEAPREATPPTPTLIHTLLHAINTHIDKQVEEKVSAVLQAHGTMKYIDESFKEVIQDIAEEAISEHNDREEHLTNDSVLELMDDRITEQVRREVRDIDIDDKISNYLDNNDIDIDDKISNYLDNNDILDSDQVREMIDEVIEEKVMEVFEEKVMEVLKKLLEKLNGV